MTQTNNEREAFEKPEYWEEFEKWWETHGQYCRAGGGEYEKSFAWAAFEYLKSQSPISQNGQQEAVANLWEALGKWSAYLASNGEQANLAPPSWLIDAVSSATSPHKQIPDGWKPIETAPNDGTQVIIKCSGGRVATAFYDDKPFVGEGWHVVVPFLGGFGSGTDTFIYFPEDMPTHWMPLPEAPTTSETNTEVGE